MCVMDNKDRRAYVGTVSAVDNMDCCVCNRPKLERKCSTNVIIAFWCCLLFYTTKFPNVLQLFVRVCISIHTFLTAPRTFVISKLFLRTFPYSFTHVQYFVVAKRDETLSAQSEIVPFVKLKIGTLKNCARRSRNETSTYLQKLYINRATRGFGVTRLVARRSFSVELLARVGRTA